MSQTTTHEQAPKNPVPVPVMALAWLWVLVPFGYGVYNLVIRAQNLFG